MKSFTLLVIVHVAFVLTCPLIAAEFRTRLNGTWDDRSIWEEYYVLNGGLGWWPATKVPGKDDDSLLRHQVTVGALTEVGTLSIDGGGLRTDEAGFDAVIITTGNSNLTNSTFGNGNFIFQKPSDSSPSFEFWNGITGNGTIVLGTRGTLRPSRLEVPMTVSEFGLLGMASGTGGTGLQKLTIASELVINGKVSVANAEVTFTDNAGLVVNGEVEFPSTAFGANGLVFIDGTLDKNFTANVDGVLKFGHMNTALGIGLSLGTEGRILSSASGVELRKPIINDGVIAVTGGTLTVTEGYDGSGSFSCESGRLELEDLTVASELRVAGSGTLDILGSISSANLNAHLYLNIETRMGRASFLGVPTTIEEAGRLIFSNGSSTITKALVVLGEMIVTSPLITFGDGAALIVNGSLVFPDVFSGAAGRAFVDGTTDNSFIANLNGAVLFDEDDTIIETGLQIGPNAEVTISGLDIELNGPVINNGMVNHSASGLTIRELFSGEGTFVCNGSLTLRDARVDGRQNISGTGSLALAGTLTKGQGGHLTTNVLTWVRSGCSIGVPLVVSPSGRLLFSSGSGKSNYYIAEQVTIDGSASIDRSLISFLDGAGLTINGTLDIPSQLYQAEFETLKDNTTDGNFVMTIATTGSMVVNSGASRIYLDVGIDNYGDFRVGPSGSMIRLGGPFANRSNGQMTLYRDVECTHSIISEGTITLGNDALVAEDGITISGGSIEENGEMNSPVTIDGEVVVGGVVRMDSLAVTENGHIKFATLLSESVARLSVRNAVSLQGKYGVKRPFSFALTAGNEYDLITGSSISGVSKLTEPVVGNSLYLSAIHTDRKLGVRVASTQSGDRVIRISIAGDTLIPVVGLSLLGDERMEVGADVTFSSVPVDLDAVIRVQESVPEGDG